MPQLAADTFTRADANDLGANWTTIVVEGEQIGVTTNAAKHKSLGSGDACSSYSATTWPNDQYSEVACQCPDAAEGAGVGHGPAVRISTAGAVTLYRAVLGSSGGGFVEVGKFVAGVFTSLGTRSTAWTSGDILRLEAQGTTLRVYRNGVQLGASMTDAGIASGRAGVAYSSTSGPNNQMDNWAGGSLTVNTAPSAPQSLSATPGNVRVILSWAPPASDGGSAVTGYKIYRSTVSGGETLLASPAGTSTGYTDLAVVAGTTYFYKVSAVNAVGESVLSNEASATPTSSATAPSAPLALSATGGVSQIVLTWSVPSSDGGSAILNYKIYRSTSAGAETLLANPASTATNYTDPAVVIGTTYYYKVSAVNAIGESALSNESSAIASATAGEVRTFKRLYGPTLLGNAAATLYTCPAATAAVIRHIHISNPSGSPVDFTLSIGSSAAGTRLWDAIPILADDVLDHYQDHAVAAGEIIQGFAGTAATLNLTIDGYELTTTAAPPVVIYPSDTLFPSDSSP